MDTTTLRPLVTASGPFTSVYFEDSHDTADAEKQLELKWRELKDALTAQHAPDGAVGALESAILDGPRATGRSGRALLAAGERVVVDEHLPSPPASTIARVSDLPYLLPLARYGELALPHVVAEVDQVSATVKAFDEHGHEMAAEEVSGQDHPVHHTRGGGEAHHRMQHRTEEVKRHNVADIAGVIARLAEQANAQLIVVAGEVQGRKAVIDELPEAAKSIAREATHSDVADELAEAVRQSRLNDVVQQFRDALNQPDGLAVQGLEAVTAALREANVETLLVGDPGEDVVCTGPAPAQIALGEEELKAYGATEIHRCRADEAVPAAAIAVDADLVHVDEELVEGFGAILRHR
ncbi:Vms1/Ankzf1 family peptidyl-tRNA hydrolase [Amycolatopsis sp. ATCC 39116]|uniref:Rv2629 family ribosome hibernation factor n=1 Tax=Amycolatopsis sp. (strain ATCC 39116 / 75iv2) TaxID=385957 RepID=UPI00026271E4|nr:Vms1/Ankzf1 family peptidyl-tRNA hydrolase [Amycolatopsis sp. ATCC 39116]